MTSLQQQVEAVLGSLPGVRVPLAVSPEESLFDSGILDSFTLLALVAALEEAFRIKIPDADLRAATFESTGKIVDYIRGHLG